MARGKRIVFTVSCAENDKSRIGTVRLHKDKNGVTWKDQQNKMKKYCKVCMKRVAVKLKEEKHSS